MTMVAGQDLQFAVQGNCAVSVRNGLGFYTYGKASDPIKPNQETGIKLHAASGNVRLEAQTDAVKITADKAIEVASTNGMVRITTPNHILFTAAGAALDIQAGSITLKGTGMIEFRASMKSLTGGSTASATPINFPRSTPIAPTDLEFRRVYADGSPIAGLKYKATFADRSTRSGATDAAGLATLSATPPGAASVVYGLDPNPPKVNIQMEVDDDFKLIFGRKSATPAAST